MTSSPACPKGQGTTEGYVESWPLTTKTSDVRIEIPLQVPGYHLLEHRRVIAAHHRHVALEPLPAQVRRQTAHARQFDHRRADCRAEHIEVRDLRFEAGEALREIAAVRTDALVGRLAVVVVRVEQCG